MNRNTSFTLGEHFANFVAQQVQSGRYGSASDVMRAGLRLLEEHENRALELRQALMSGIASGEPRSFDFEAFKARKRAERQQ